MTSNDRDTSVHVLAFDIGGTRIKAGLLELSSRSLLRSLIVDTPTSIDGLLDELRSLGKTLARDSHIEACGLCVPGLVSEEGTVTDLPGKLEGIVGIDLRKELS